MTDKRYARTITKLELVIKQMQFLVEHPRMQQKNWVASGKDWLPVLHEALEDLSDAPAPTEDSAGSILVALEHVGLRVEKRTTLTWGYRWYNGDLIGHYPTRADAIEDALRDRFIAERDAGN